MESKTRQNWRTPPWFFKQLNEDFGPFEMDVAATEDDTLCGTWPGKTVLLPPPEGLCHFKADSLRGPWREKNFCNPGFGNVRPWHDKALKQSGVGRLTVVLGLHTISAQWFHQAAVRGTVYIPDKRIQYWHPEEKKRDSFNRDTIVTVYGPNYTRPVGSPLILPYQCRGFEKARDEMKQLTADYEKRLAA